MSRKFLGERVLDRARLFSGRQSEAALTSATFLQTLSLQAVEVDPDVRGAAKAL